MSNIVETTKTLPVAKISVGLQSASIWKNENEKGVFYQVTFDRRYRNKNGDWKSTAGYAADDLLALAKLADLAHSKVIELQTPAK